MGLRPLEIERFFLVRKVCENDEKFLEKLQSVIPMGRNVHRDDIANLVVWLCSDQSNMLIGQTINVDGGFSLASWREFLD